MDSRPQDTREDSRPKNCSNASQSFMYCGVNAFMRDAGGASANNPSE